MSRHQSSLRPSLALLPLAAACMGLGLAGKTASATPIVPTFSPGDFVPGAAIDNTYFPVPIGVTRVFEGSYEEDGETVTEHFELTRLGLGPTLAGVQTITVRDRAFEDDVLVEDTFDYYAQDIAGNVWYMGEDVTNYVYDEDGDLVETNSASSWLSGVNGAQPGYQMPVDTTPGFNYYQEFAEADEAVDQAITDSNDNVVEVGGVTYADVLKVLEFTDLDPGVFEYKYYAPEVGLILVDEGIDLDTGGVAFQVALSEVRTVPEPASAALLLGGLGLLTAARRRRIAQLDGNTAAT